MTQPTNKNGRRNPTNSGNKPAAQNKPTTTTTPKPTGASGQTTPPKPPTPTGGQGAPAQRKLSPRQEAARRKAQKRRQIQILITGIVGVVAAIAIIVTVLLVNSPYKFNDVPAQATLDTAPLTIGNADAKVTLIEYFDLRCVVCKQYFDEAYSQIKTVYVTTGKVKYEHRHLTVIDTGLKDGVSNRMAQGAMCAADQKRSIDYIETSYRNYPGERVGFPDDKWIKNLADALKLNMNDFNTCLDSNKYRQAVTDQTREASTKGASGTPTFFVKVGNGAEELVTITSASAFFTTLSSKLDEALQKAGN
jgi:protein-disulfide isomerase